MKMMEDNRRRCRSWLRFHRTKLITAINFLSVVSGVCVGMVLKDDIIKSSYLRSYLHFLLKIFFDCLQLVTVPLIVTNGIIRISEANFCNSKNVNSNALVYFFLTTLSALLTGLVLVQLTKPGINHRTTNFETFDNDDDPVDAVLDLIMNAIPANLFQATFQHDKTKKIVVKAEADDDDSNLKVKKTEVVQSSDGVNMVGLTVLLFLSGKAMRKMKKRGRGRVLMNLIITFNLLAKHFVRKIIRCLPVGILFLIASAVIMTEDNWETALCLIKFIGVVMIGLIIHGVVVLPLIFLLFARKNPFPVIRAVFTALKRALIVSNSYPASQMYKCCEEVLNIDRRITQFMLPIGIDVNKDGTVLYEMAAAIFVIQLNGTPLTWSMLFTLGVTVAVSTVGEEGFPVAGAVTTLFILSVSKVPAVYASFLLATHWLINRCTAVVNILGDCIGVALVEHLSTRELAKTK